MDEQTLETRVGCMAMSILRDELKEYIILHTRGGKYTGEPMYLQHLQDVLEYLKSEQEGRNHGG